MIPVALPVFTEEDLENVNRALVRYFVERQNIVLFLVLTNHCQVPDLKNAQPNDVKSPQGM